MLLPEYRLIGPPRRYCDGRGKPAKSYAQKFRLLNDPSRRIQSITLQTSDGTAARRRAVAYVERRIQTIAFDADPHARTLASCIHAALVEYIDDLTAQGNTRRQADLVKHRLERVLTEARLTEYAQLDPVKVTKAIADLKAKEEFTTVATANKYREAMRAWSRWMVKNGRWPNNPLEFMPKFKGDTTTSRRRAILTDDQFTILLTSTHQGPPRRNLTGEQRYWLYLLASQTGLRAQELHSLTPQSFHLKEATPFVEVHCTISKRRTTDRVELHPELAKLLSRWLRDKPHGRGLWSDSVAWFNKAATMLRDDLAAAELPSTISTPDGPAIVDFHSFRAYRVTQAIMTGANSRVVLATVRLSCEALLDRYAKIPKNEITACTRAIPVPSVLTKAAQR
ncbi:tyrosine-type recombinase/integrase [Lacipirellula sp.]|uniref:tyrosine-type recombinase/integrase n=1 Tax=Lacipirellula sp. TaxID=2691419 RepID=UPI003D099FAC